MRIQNKYKTLLKQLDHGLVHYGRSKFLKENFETIQNDWKKPTGGLWTSPIKTNYGWKNFCESEDFRTNSLDKWFNIKLSKNSRVYVINSLQDLEKCFFVQEVINKNSYYKNYYLDFEKISKKFDAIWLTEEGQWKTRLSHPINLYGWDCETVLILNQHCICQMPKNQLTIKMS